MTQQIGGYPPYPASGAPAGQSTTEVARDEATDVGRTAADAGRQVAGTAVEQAGNVAQEVKSQARDLVGEARGQVQDQARNGQQKAAEGVRALGRELREMADGGQQSGPVSEIARQAADRADTVATWLGEREPGDLLAEVRSFARRRPGVFLLGMAAAGVVVGRLTRGAVDSARADAGPPPQPAYQPAYGSPANGEPGYARTPGTALPPYGAPSGPPPVAYDAPTPPQGYASPPTHAAPYPAPRAAAGPAYDPDPLAEPVGRPAGTVDEYDEYGERRTAGPDEPFDDPYRPGGGSLR